MKRAKITVVGAGNVGASCAVWAAQKELGDIVYVELPKIGEKLAGGSEAAVLESTKAAADVYAPLSGKVTAVNDLLQTEPEKVNTSAEGEGWLCKIELTDPTQAETLLSQEQYLVMIE